MSIPVERLERDVATAAPLITVEVFESFPQCETKSKLYSQGEAETDFEFKKWLRRERDCFKEDGLSWLRTMCQEDQFSVGTPSAYQAILERLRAGSLIHADETKVAIEGADRFVWVFTNLEEVAFVYGDTGEPKPRRRYFAISAVFWYRTSTPHMTVLIAPTKSVSST